MQKHYSEAEEDTLKRIDADNMRFQFYTDLQLLSSSNPLEKEGALKLLESMKDILSKNFPHGFDGFFHQDHMKDIQQLGCLFIQHQEAAQEFLEILSGVSRH